MSQKRDWTSQRRDDMNRGRSRATAVPYKEEKQQSSSIKPYLFGALIGAGAALVSSYFVGQQLEGERQAYNEGCRRDGNCKKTECAVCLDEAVPTFRTRCCGQLMHGMCVQELRRNMTDSKCPYCRSSAWF